MSGSTGLLEADLTVLHNFRSIPDALVLIEGFAVPPCERRRDRAATVAVGKFHPCNTQRARSRVPDLLFPSHRLSRRARGKPRQERKNRRFETAS